MYNKMVPRFSEEVILNEDRTTEEERMHILSGELGLNFQMRRISLVNRYLQSPSFHLVRKRLAAKKRKLKANEKSKSTDTEDESTYDYCHDDGMAPFRPQNIHIYEDSK